RWRLNWRPSKAERRKHPELPEDAQLSGWLMAQEGEHPEQGELTLYLFSTEEMGNEQAAATYGRRWGVGRDIRDLKQTLLLWELQGRGEGMVGKEVAMAAVAFNLVNQTRRLAAGRAGVQPRRLSFKGTWSILKALGLGLCELDPSRWQAEFD